MKKNEKRERDRVVCLKNQIEAKPNQIWYQMSQCQQTKLPYIDSINASHVRIGKCRTSLLFSIVKIQADSRTKKQNDKADPNSKKQENMSSNPRNIGSSSLFHSRQQPRLSSQHRPCHLGRRRLCGRILLAVLFIPVPIPAVARPCNP